ncbi:MAG: ATP-binding protein [Polyangiales bacterium]
MGAAVQGAADEGPAARQRSLDQALRDLHAMKGSAGTLGLRGVARAAHALEGALSAVRARAATPTKIELDALESARSRLLRAALDPAGEDAAAVLPPLRAAGLLRARDVALVDARTDARAAAASDDEHVRVPAAQVARASAAAGEAWALERGLAARAAEADGMVRALESARRALESARRALGPARPWGVAAEVLERVESVEASLGAARKDAERAARGLRLDAEALGGAVREMRGALEGIERVEAGWIFDRVAAAARGSGARVTREGDGVEVERAAAERLVEPLRQLVRNALAHGVEPAEERMARGKPGRATVRLVAEATPDGLRLAVEDDGRGVDLAAVRARAILDGRLPPGAAASEAELLALLFARGFTTRAEVSPEAGRGIGLDLVREEVARLGGRARATSRAGEGARFELRLPRRAAAARVLPLRCASGLRVLVPVGSVAAVELRPRGASDEPGWAPGGARGDERWRVRVRGEGGELSLAAVAVDAPAEVALRALPRRARAAGPWRAAAVDVDGAVMLVLDVEAAVASRRVNVAVARGAELDSRLRRA